MSSGPTGTSAGVYKTPEYFHCITDARFRSNVYEPEADTFLFMEALDKDIGQIAARVLRHGPDDTRQRRRCCVEIGCGSGTVLTHLGALLLQEQAARHDAASQVHMPFFIAVDVNPIALEATAKTWTDTMTTFFPQYVLPDEASCSASLVHAANAGVPITTAHDAGQPSRPILHTVRGDLLAALPPATTNAVNGETSDPFLCDVILFNPPYVPTSMEELEATIHMNDIITAAWSGGPRGRVVLDRFLQQLPSRLAPDGACYIVLIKENDVDDVYAFVQQQFRLFHGHDPHACVDVVKMEQVTSRYTGEHLSIHRIVYTHPPSTSGVRTGPA